MGSSAYDQIPIPDEEGPPKPITPSQLPSADPATSTKMLTDAKSQSQAAQISLAHGMVKAIVGNSGQPIQFPDGHSYGERTGGPTGGIDAPPAMGSEEPLDAPTGLGMLERTSIICVIKELLQPQTRNSMRLRHLQFLIKFLLTRCRIISMPLRVKTVHFCKLKGITLRR